MSLSAGFAFPDTVVILRRSYLRRVDSRVTIFSGVHVRSFVRPHGGTLELLGQIRYIRCHTGAYLPHLSRKTIVLSQILHSFHPSIEIYCICLIDCYSCDFRRDELSVEHDVQVWITPLARTIQWIVMSRSWS